MKPKKEETLSRELLYIDEDLLHNAYTVDSPEKLKHFKKRKAKTKSALFFSAPAAKRLGAVAAITALIAGIFLLPRLPKEPGGQLQGPPLPSFTESYGGGGIPSDTPTDGPMLPPPSGGETPIFTVPENPVQIISMDMLNYYAAMRCLTVSGIRPTAYSTGSASVKLLENTENTENTEGPPVTTGPEQPKETFPDKTYYEFEPDFVFYVNSVVYFQIRLTSAEGFLASKVGTGVIDVVITDNSVDPMITFKNGDRFYSCLASGKGIRDYEPADRRYHIDFSAHKYIEGFSVVKDLALEDHRFYVHLSDTGKVTALEIPFDPNADPQNSQIPLVGDTFITQVGAGYTIQEIEEFLLSLDISQV